MKYIVKSLITFNDYEGLEVKPENKSITRKAGDIFTCTKDRYLYLKERNAVVLMGINKASKITK